MIIDLPRFIAEERPFWDELEAVLGRMEADPGHSLSLEAARRFHYLYQRASSDLARIMTFSSEPQLRRYLEALVGRAFAEIHESRPQTGAWHLGRRLLADFPRLVRLHRRSLALALLVTMAGGILGGVMVAVDPTAREILIPLEALHESPSERVSREEGATRDPLLGHKASFSGFLMTHNARVSIFIMALGITAGIGTILLLFYNGVILGAVAADYLLAGQGPFLLGWLLPHGAVEIPAIVIAGQAGLLLAGALIGRGDRKSLGERLRAVAGDLQTLIFGVTALLVWAGLVEAFLSQYHEPIIPYPLKIAFGTLEILLLALFFTVSGKGAGERRESAP